MDALPNPTVPSLGFKVTFVLLVTFILLLLVVPYKNVRQLDSDSQGKRTTA